MDDSVLRRCCKADIADLIPEREYRCQGCGDKVYKSRTRYENHLRLIHSVPIPEYRSFNCFHCPCGDCRHHQHRPGLSSFRQISQLRRHFEELHLTSSSRCSCWQGDSQRCSGQDDDSPVERSSCTKSSKSHLCGFCGKDFRSENALRRHKIRTDHRDQQENELCPKPPNARQQCAKCRRKFVRSHQCQELPCAYCGRVFYCKSALANHIRKTGHELPAGDLSFVDEMQQLISSIEDGKVRDPWLFKELSRLLPELQRLQDSDGVVGPFI
ncbi:hypothetical protein KR009_006739 [Drosophila setifemur]|nr:hypothetical protein KR009_006739 [Drosophila setifemur]